MTASASFATNPHYLLFFAEICINSSFILNVFKKNTVDLGGKRCSLGVKDYRWIVLMDFS